MREFDTGASRDDNDGKYVYTRFNSALVEKRFAKYMHEHRVQADGKLRDGGNWKFGIPMDAYEDSLGRHYHDLWEMLETDTDSITDSSGKVVTRQDVLCALRFNINGMLHEELLFEDELGAMEEQEEQEEAEEPEPDDEDDDPYASDLAKFVHGFGPYNTLPAVDSLSATQTNETIIDRYLREATEANNAARKLALR